MTRHSNMVVFGTNTVVGLRVGTNATQVPSIDLGYTRQEAVLMPLVANTGVTTGTGNTGAKTAKLTPCAIDNTVSVVAGTPAPPAGAALPQFVTHPCILAATDGRDARDSYSVLASFGADFGASSEPKAATARGGLAQYFATGMAAQLLALNGGAAVVATGQAAEKAAETGPVTLDGKAALAPTAADRTESAARIDGYKPLRDMLSAKVRLTKPEDLASRFNAFEGSIGGGKTNVLASCNAPDACADRVLNDYFFSSYSADPEKFRVAVATWQ